ncbi:MAG TPA: PKD domain-containing protein [Chitinophagales bacterium]|nr:PKD domain-containing protein [Chitinophagales bacterium]
MQIKRFLLALVVLATGTTMTAAQTTYYFEDFDSAPCVSGCLASGFIGWTTVAAGANGTWANEWFVSCAENGMPFGQCGSGCVGAGNNTLHIGSNIALLGLVDQGASYYAGIPDTLTGAETSKRAVSPIIDLSLACDIEIKFNYLEFGDLSTDNFFLEYTTDGGGTWATLADPPKTPCCGGTPCNGLIQGQWSSFTFNLPLAAYAPNFQLAFRWDNNDDGIGTDPSVAIDSVRIVGGAGPDPTFTMPAGPLCADDELSATVTNPDVNTTYTWDVFGLQFDGVDFPTGLFGTPPGYTVITLTAENPCDANTLTDSIQIVDCNLPPVIVITASDTAICVGDCIDFSSAGSGPGIDFYTWSFPGGDPVDAYVADPTSICYNNPFAGTYDVSLSVQTSTGAIVDTVLTSYITVSVCTVGPDVNINWDTSTVCVGGVVNFTPVCPDCVSFEWTFDGGDPATSTYQNVSVAYDTEGQYTVTLTGTDVNGNTTTQTLAAAINVINCSAGPTVDFTWDLDEICSGEQVTFTADCPTCIEFLWEFQGGTPGSSPAANPTVTYNTPSPLGSPYNVQLIGTDANGVSDTILYVDLITVNPCGDPPVADFTPSADTVCAGGFLTFVNASAAALDAVYTWTFAGGTPSSSVQQNPGQIVFVAAGTYDVTLVVSDAYGEDSVTLSVTAVDCPVPVAFFTASDEDICKNESVTFTDASENATSWNWTFDGGSPASSTDQNPAAVFYNTPGLYTATLTVSDGTGQDSTYSVSINVSGCGIPTPAFTVSDNTVCTGGCVQFYDVSLDYPTGWLWSFPGAEPASSSQQNPPYVCYNTPGTYPVQLTAFNLLGADTTVVQGFITVYAPFVPTTNVDSAEIVMGQTVTLTAGGGVTYQWYPMDSAYADSLPTAMAAPLQTTTYTVIATNANDCTGSAQVVVNVRPPDMVFVPNLFTPNGDRVNDILKMQYTGAVERAEFAVFDRWGNRVFYSTDENVGWDGTYNGSPVNTGVYLFFYRVRFETGYVAKGKGDVTLLR